jgi:hypothetical protein
MFLIDTKVRFRELYRLGARTRWSRCGALLAARFRARMSQSRQHQASVCSSD